MNKIVEALRATPSRSKRTLLDTAASEIERLTDRCARYAEEISVLQERTRWVPVEERLPEGDSNVLAIVYGRPERNIELIGSVQIAAYSDYDAGWFVPEYPRWEDPRVTHWMPLPEPPEVEG